MNRALTIPLILASLTASSPAQAETERRFPIERSHPISPLPLVQEDLLRMKAGDPPRPEYIHSPERSFFRGYFAYSTPKGSYEMADPRIGFALRQNAKFSPAEMVDTFDSEGMCVLRDDKGVIRKAGTRRDWFFVSTEDDAIVIERYFSRDCAADEHGEMHPLPNVICAGRSELREIEKDPDPNTRRFRITFTSAREGIEASQLVEITLTESKGQSQVVARTYQGLEPVPEAQTKETFLERVIWPEGPGYRQIVRRENLHENGRRHLEKHVVESWRVQPDGRREKVDEEDLEKRKAEQPAEELH